MQMAKARFWIFVNKNLHAICILGLIVVALALLQVCLCYAFPEMSVLWISYFSMAMNTVFLFLGAASLIGWAGYYLAQNVKVEFGADPEATKLLDPGVVSVAPDIAIFSLSEDEAPDAFLARATEAFAEDGGQKWVLVMAFRHYLIQVKMNNDVGEKTEVAHFLRDAPFKPCKPSFEDIARNKAMYEKESFADYVNYCKELSKDFKIWAATEKIGRTNPFVGATEFLRSQFASVLILLFASLPLFGSAQTKTEQISAYLGDRAEMETPAGKMVDYIFTKREISVLSTGKSYIETIKDAAFFRNANDAGRLLLIKVGGEKIMPKSPVKQVAATATPEPDQIPTVGGGPASEGFYESLPDSISADAMINQDNLERQQNWVRVKPSVKLWMHRFHRLLGTLFIFACFLWAICAIGASEALNDMGAVKIVSEFLVSVYVVSKSALMMLWMFVFAVYTLEAMITHHYTGELSAWFFFKFSCFAAFTAFLFKWVFPDMQRRRGGNSSIVATAGYPHRQLNG